MNDLKEKKEQCPYCAETIDILIDPSEMHQSYTEDCQVCCQPIMINVTISHNGEMIINLYQENE